ncbi:hypothetical protein [Microbacterium sp. NPDC055357]
MTEYVIELDENDWLGIPPGFPYLQWEDAAAWATQLAAAAVPDDAESRAVFEAMALSVASERPPQVDQALWFAPLDGRAMGVAYLSVFEQDATTPALPELAVLGLDSPTPVQVTRHTSVPFGEVLQSAATIRLADVGGDPDDSVAGSIRTVGIAGGLVFMLNAVDENLDVLAVMQEPLLELMESIRLLQGEDELDRAVARILSDDA